MGSVFDQFPVAGGTRLLLVDDNPKLCRMVKEYLEPLGYDIALAHTGPDGLEKALHGGFDAVILDVMLPGLDGFSVLKQLRTESEVPVLMLTGRGEAPDRIAGLELGADDYVPKTFSPRELLARLRAVIRRSVVTAARVRRAPQPSIVVGVIEVDPEKRQASFHGQALALTPTEFDLLLALARDCGRVKTREQLLLDVTDRDFESFDRSIDMHISSLRRPEEAAYHPDGPVSGIHAAGARQGGGIMKPRLPLYTKVLALAFLNLCLLGLAIIVIVRAQFRFDPGSFLLAPAQSRIMNVAHTLALELEEVPAANWDAVLSRYSQTKRRRIGALRRIGTASGRAGPDDPPAGLRQASTTPATASSRSFQSGAEAKE